MRYTATEVVMVIFRAGLDYGKLEGTQQGAAQLYKYNH